MTDTPMFGKEYTEQDVIEDIRDVLLDPDSYDIKDANLIATLATFISSPILSDITKAMSCIDMVRGHDSEGES